MRNLHYVNGASTLRQYRPISLIHYMDKLISKLLSNRLAPRLSELVHPSQIAFIKHRFIQDNFKYVQSAAKLLHVRKRHSLLLKVDIAQAFDSIAWPFLLEVLKHLGFSLAWSNRVSALLYSPHTKVLFNGVTDDQICHARGLCKGDLLSPMLFLLVMEVLSALIHKTDSWSLWQPLGL
jgi:hypothetical protein